jgi:hypothetical protein
MKKQLTIICIIGMLLVVGISGCLENNKDGNSSITPSSEKVTVTTNKIEYRQNETIKILIQNNMNYTVNLLIPFYAIEKNNGNTWIVMRKTLYPCEEQCVLGQIFPYLTIEPYGFVEYQWNQKETWCSDQFGNCSPTISVSVTSGIYRVKCEITYNEIRSSVYSNEFIISNSTNDVLITTDKGIYNSNTGINDGYIQGDFINITIINHLENDIFFNTCFIIPFCTLYFEIYSNGSWESYTQILGVAHYPRNFSFQDWLDTTPKLRPNDCLTFQYDLSHSGGFNMFQGKYRFRLDYFSISDEPLVNYSDVDFATYLSKANFVSVYSNNFTIMNFPIDGEEDAVSYAKTISNLSEFINSIKNEYNITYSVNYDEDLDYWYVVCYPDSKDVADLDYSVVFKSDGTMIYHGPVPI